MRLLLPVALCSLLLAACERDAPTSEPAEQAATPQLGTDQPTEPVPPAAAQDPNTELPGAHTFGPEISAEDFTQHVRVLASDAFGGRAPGSEGEQRTIDYLVAQFERLGLQPGNGDSFVQTVPMVKSQAAADTTLTLTADGQSSTLRQGEEMVLVTRTAQPEVSVSDSELVFVGYGVVAPEHDWNDYAGLDVKGKTVVMLVNDPGFHAGDESLFGGKRMTWYGRWAYKYEEAARQGAAAALIIHDTPGAGYGWDVVANSWTGAEFDLPTEVDPAPRIPLQGWLTQDAAQQLFARAGLDLAALQAAAGKPGFKPVPMDATLSATLNTTTSTGESRNVLGLLRGATKPEELIIYIAHWDHLGTNENLQGDQIFNGAIDNASGIAGMLEIAEAFVTQGKKPERSVLFMPVTLEESGLLGAKYYVANPVFPLKDTVAAINLDALRGEMVGPTKDVVVIGHGSSELEDVLAEAAATQQRSVEPEAESEKGFYYRSDHFNFAKAGVPALYAKSGIDHVERGREYGLAQQQRYTDERYHKPDDEYDPSWDLRGIVQDLQLLHRVGAVLAADPERWPNWREGTEFRAARDAMRKPAE